VGGEDHCTLSYLIARSRLNDQFTGVSPSPFILSTSMKLSIFALLAFILSSVQADVELVVSNGKNPDGSGGNGLMIEWSGSLDVSNFTLDFSGNSRLRLSSFASFLEWDVVGSDNAFDEYLVQGIIAKPGPPDVVLGPGVGFGGIIGMGDKRFGDAPTYIRVPANYTSGSALSGQVFFLDEKFESQDRSWTLSFESEANPNLTQRMLFRTEASAPTSVPTIAPTAAPATIVPTIAPTSSSGCMMLGGVVGAFMAISMLLV
jgi:hypothetical protein